MFPRPKPISNHFQGSHGSHGGLRPLRKPRSRRKGCVEEPGHSDPWFTNIGRLGHEAPVKSHLLRAVAEGGPTKTLTDRSGPVGSRLEAQPRGLFAFSSVCGVGCKVLLVVRSLATWLTCILDAFGSFDSGRAVSGTMTCSDASPLAGACVSAKVPRHWGSRRHESVGSCAGTPPESKKLYSFMLSMAKVVSPLLGIDYRGQGTLGQSDRLL